MPTVVICSDEFGPLARAEARALSYPGLPLVAVPHPLAGNAPGLVVAKGQAVVDAVLRALTGSPEELADEQRDRFTKLTQRRLEAGALCLDEVCALDLPTR